MMLMVACQPEAVSEAPGPKDWEGGDSACKQYYSVMAACGVWGLSGCAGGFIGYVDSDEFLRNVWASFGEPLRLVSAGTIPLANIAIGMKVGAGLFAIFLALGASRFKMKD